MTGLRWKNALPWERFFFFSFFFFVLESEKQRNAMSGMGCTGEAGQTARTNVVLVTRMGVQDRMKSGHRQDKDSKVA